MIYSQKNLLSGYVVTMKGDTLQGYIDYRNWEKNPDHISFQKSMMEKGTDFTPDEIQMFSVADEIYLSANIEISNDTSNPKSTELDKSSVNKSKRVFMQTMILGPKSLYYYGDKNGNDSFYINSEKGYELLYYRKYEVNHDGKKIIEENNKYIGQLILYFSDCPVIQSKLKNISYNKKNLENVFYYYYDCTQSEMKFHKVTEKTKTEFGILAGGSLTTLNFTSDGYSYLVNSDFSNSVNFSAGLFLNFVLPRNQGKWSINNELLFASYKLENSYTDFNNEDYYTVYNITLKYPYLKLNNMVRLRFPAGNSLVYFNIGISNGLAINETNMIRKEIKQYSAEEIEEIEAVPDGRKYEQGFLFGLGTKLKNLGFEMRYERGNGMTSTTGLETTSNRFYFLFAYTL